MVPILKGFTDAMQIRQWLYQVVTLELTMPDWLVENLTRRRTWSDHSPANDPHRRRCRCRSTSHGRRNTGRYTGPN